MGAPAYALTEGLQTDWPSVGAGPPPPRRSRLGFLRELPALIVFAFTLAIVIKSLLIQAFFIPSASMEPTLHGCVQCSDADRVLVNKLVYRFREPQRGEVIVFVAQRDTREKTLFQKVRSLLTEGLGVSRPNEKDYIKRVIGLPGDTIQVKDDGVYITPPGAKRIKLTEPYIASPDEMGPTFGPFKVPAGTYFVMGDNRGNSSDSRSLLGPIKREDIIGKAFVRIWPVWRAGILHVPEYPKPVPKAKRAPEPRKKKRALPAMPSDMAALAFAGMLVPPLTRRARAVESPR